MIDKSILDQMHSHPKRPIYYFPDKASLYCYCWVHGSFISHIKFLEDESICIIIHNNGIEEIIAIESKFINIVDMYRALIRHFYKLEEQTKILE